MLEKIESLCNISGISGDEGRVAEYLTQRIATFGGEITVNVDNLGNVIAHKKGKERAKNKVMLCAHMDEVGFIVTSITDDGMLRFSAVGGIDSRVVIGRQVSVGEKGHIGVIGTKAVHMQNKKERGTAPDIDDLFIDIGAKDKEDALHHIKIGDSAVFVSEYAKFGDDRIKAKALDDRAGCAILLDIMEGEIPFDTYFVFTVQEEVGLRGARTASYNVRPDFAIVVETTTASDIPGVSGEKRVCKLGGGPVVSYMDRGTIYDEELYKLAGEISDENGIPHQTKTVIAGGNDSGAIHTSVGGIRTIAVSMPCRYLHSPNCVLKVSDIMATRTLVEKLSERVAQL